MASEKRSISFDEAVLREAEARVAAAGGNLSAFVNASVLHELNLLAVENSSPTTRSRLGPYPLLLRAAVASEWPA